MNFGCPECFKGYDEIGEVVSGWYLFKHQTKTEYIFTNDDHNDYTFKFTIEPMEEPGRGLSDEDLESFLEIQENYDRSEEFASRVDNVDKIFKSDIETGYELYTACLKNGYDPEKHGQRIMWWLFDKMGQILRTWAFEKSKDI